jgi:hypothetical protein
MSVLANQNVIFEHGNLIQGDGSACVEKQIWRPNGRQLSNIKHFFFIVASKKLVSNYLILPPVSDFPGFQCCFHEDMGRIEKFLNG